MPRRGTSQQRQHGSDEISKNTEVVHDGDIEPLRVLLRHAYA